MSDGDWPRLGAVAHDDTARLIPGRHADESEPSLVDLVDTPDELGVLLRLSGVTDTRLQAQQERHPAALGRADLVFGVPYSKIINAAFSYGGQGARFHPRGPKGVWYCALGVETSLAEVAHHRVVHLAETGMTDEFDVPYRLFLADIHAQDVALLDDGHPSSVACLTPNSYVEGQALGRRLRSESRGGVRYPSVRHPGGTCLAVLQAPIVSNVRRAATYRLSFRNSSLVGVDTSPPG